MYLHDKHFSVEEARNIVTEIADVIGEMRMLKSRLDGIGYDIYRHQYFGGAGPNGERFHPRELERMVGILQEIHERGIQVKSVEDGLLDFPHIRSNGEEVYLCWKSGEHTLEFWHSISDGFAGRRHIDEL